MPIMVAPAPKPPEAPSEEDIIQELKKTVKSEIGKCAAGTELEVLHRVLSPDPWTLQFKCMVVRVDLQVILHPFRLERIDLFGSTVMGVAFLGLI